MAKKVVKKVGKKRPAETEAESREELDDQGIAFDIPEDAKETTKKPVVKRPAEEVEEEEPEEEQDEETDEEEEPEEAEETPAPKKYKSQNEEFTPVTERHMHILPFLFMIFGLASLAFFIMTFVLLFIPYYLVPTAGYVVIVIASLILAALSYIVITKGSDSGYAIAWGGLMVPLFPLAGMMFLQRVMLELALRRSEVTEAISRPIPTLFAPIFDSTYPLPLVITIIFHAAYTIPFVIFLIRKKPFAALYFIAAPLFFVALWFLLAPLIDQTVFSWVAYFKSL